MFRVKCKVKRDDFMTYTRDFAPWEVPIVDFIFGEGNLQVVKEVQTDEEDTTLPADAEYDRLRKRYGRDEETGVDYVASIYGAGAPGVRNLEKAMKDASRRRTGLTAVSVVRRHPAVVKAMKSKLRRAQVRPAMQLDPLLM